MANPMDMLKKAIKPAKTSAKMPDESAAEEASEPAINELVERVLVTRNLVHVAHWNTGSYASHMALNDLYDAIVGATDDVVENYQGEFGTLKNLNFDCACLDKDIIEYILEDATWLRENQEKVCKGSKAISSLIDILVSAYNKCLYKLKNLN